MINTLSNEQKSRFGEWAQKWIDIGLSTEPADFGASTAAALRAYALCGLQKPMVVLHMSSPYAATVGGALACMLLRDSQARDQVGSQVGDQVRDQVGSQVRDQALGHVGYQVWDQVGYRVWGQVWDQVGSQVGSQVRDQVGSQVGSQVSSQVCSQVCDQVGFQVSSRVWGQVGSQVRDQVRDQVWSQVGSQVGDQVLDQVLDQVRVSGALIGATKNAGASNLSWAGFAAWVSYLRDVAGWRGSKLANFEVAETIVKSCGWTWWHQNVLAISDRPRVINRDDLGRLHCETGPSIAYRDGWSMHHWHGTERPPAPTGERVLSVILAVVIGVSGALILFHGWSGGFR